MSVDDLPYVDGFVLPIAEDKLEAYRDAASGAAAIWKEHGALEYYECAGDDMNVEDQVRFPDLMGAKEGETVVFAFAIYASKAARDKANKRIMKDPRIKEICALSGDCFDFKRMAFGGFQTIVKG